MKELSKYFFVHTLLTLFVFFVWFSFLTTPLVRGYLDATFLNDISQGELYDLTNQTRILHGVGRLRVSTELEKVAKLKLVDMFQNNYFAHTSPVGVEPWVWFRKSGYNYRMAGENLAKDFSSSEGVLNAWLSSESHSKNLLSKDFKEIGIAVGSGIIDGHKTVAVVQVFGTPQVVIDLVAKK